MAGVFTLNTIGTKVENSKHKIDETDNSKVEEANDNE